MRNGRMALLLILVFLPTLGFATPKKEKSFGVALFFKFSERYDGTVGYLKNGIDLAKDDFKKEHPNVNIKLKDFDHENAFETVISSANEIIKSKYPVVIGGEDSHHAMVMGDIFKDKNVVLMSPTATNPEVTKGKPFVFRTCLTDHHVAKNVALFVGSLDTKKIGVLHGISSPYTDFLAKSFLESIKQASPSTKIVHEKYIKGKLDYSKAIENFKREKITHVVAFTYESEIFQFISQSLKAKFVPTLIGADGWGPAEKFQKKLFQVEGATRIKAYQTAYWNAGASHASAKRFIRAFRSKYKREPNSWDAIGYDTATLAFHAMNNAKDPSDGNSIRQSIANLGERSLATTKSFKFADDNSPTKELPIFRIDAEGVRHFKTVGR